MSFKWETYHRMEEDAALGQWADDFLKGLDLHWHSDLDTREVRDIRGQHRTVTFPVYAVSTEEDRSVGIYGAILSPWFDSERKLMGWLMEHEREVEAYVLAEYSKARDEEYQKWLRTFRV